MDIQEWERIKTLVIENHAPEFKQLLGDGLSIKACDNHHLLHLAAAHGETLCLKALIEAGSDVNAIDDLGNTATHVAARAGSTDCLALLIQAGADMHRQNHKLWTPIMCAAADDAPACAELLIHAGASTGSHDAELLTPPMWAAFHSQPTSLKLMLDRGFALETRDHEGRTAASYASRVGAADCLQLLLLAGCDPNAHDHDGMSLAMNCAVIEHASDGLECMRLLLAHPIDMEARNARGETAALVALRENAPGCLGVLIMAGCDLSELDLSRPTARAIADPPCRFILDREMARREALLISADAKPGKLRPKAVRI
jgi:ankyrin repeat protein